MLGSELDVDSVATVLLLSDMHNAPELKSKCIDFIAANSEKVIPTEAYRNLRKTQIELMAELFEALSLKIASK